jgi:hypothetical protein
MTCVKSVRRSGRWKQCVEVNAGGGCRRWVQEVGAGGGCRRWVQEVGAGGGCRRWVLSYLLHRHRHSSSRHQE